LRAKTASGYYTVRSRLGVAALLWKCERRP
jgi:hypothetical protein